MDLRCGRFWIEAPELLVPTGVIEAFCRWYEPEIQYSLVQAKMREYTMASIADSQDVMQSSCGMLFGVYVVSKESVCAAAKCGSPKIDSWVGAYVPWKAWQSMAFQA